MNQQHKTSRRLFVAPAVRNAFCAILLALLSWTLVQSAEPAKSTAATETKQTAGPPTAIAPSEIIPRSEGALKSLQDIRLQLAADSEKALDEVQKELADFSEKSDRRWRSESEAIRRLRSLQRFNDILREWSLDQSQLDGWDRALSKRSQILMTEESDVAEIYDRWQTTREAGRQQSYPKVAMDKVGEVLREADAVRGQIRDAMAKLLGLQIQLANRREILAKIRSDIDKAREQSGRDLFVLDSPPLWQAIFLPETQDVVASQVAHSVHKFSDDLREFFANNRGRILLHVLVFLGMAALFRSLARGVTPHGIDGAPDSVIVEHPIAAAFLLSALATGLFYPEATSAVLRIALIPTVVPLALLLPNRLRTKFQRWVYLLIGLYGAEFFRYLLPTEWLSTRLLLFMIGLSACIGMARFLTFRPEELPVSTRWRRIMSLSARCLLLVFAVSVISNLLGNTTLAEILVAVPIRILYLAVLIYSAAQLLVALVVIGLRSRLALALRSAQIHGDKIAARCKTLISAAAFITWAGISLFILGILGDLSAAVSAFLDLRWKVGAAEISVAAIASFFAVFVTAIVISRALRLILSEEILPRIRLPRGVPGAVDLLSRYGILLLGFFIALAASGVDLSKVTLLVSALGVGIGFGLQNVVNNFVSGLILVFEHPLQVGDLVEVGNISGEVRKIGFRASVLRTADGADVVIPNGELIGGKLINWSLSDRLRRISISVGVAYETDPNRVLEILIGVARNHPAVLADPSPTAIFDRFGDSALNFTLLCWSFVENFFLTRSELTVAINKSLREAKIEIPFPQQDIHVHWNENNGEPLVLAQAKEATRVQLKSDAEPIAIKANK